MRSPCNLPLLIKKVEEEKKKKEERNSPLSNVGGKEINHGRLIILAN